VRLAELGELTADELAALRERANEARLRTGTPGEVLSKRRLAGPACGGAVRGGTGGVTRLLPQPDGP
jgi:hypothetical protein